MLGKGILGMFLLEGLKRGKFANNQGNCSKKGLFVDYFMARMSPDEQNGSLGAPDQLTYTSESVWPGLL